MKYKEPFKLMLQTASFFQVKESKTIRSHTANQNASDSESEPEGISEDDVVSSVGEDSFAKTLKLRLRQNTRYLELKGSSWKLSNMEDGITLIRKPTASHTIHRILNPYIYRTLQKMSTLDRFAEIIGAPTNWEAVYNDKVGSNNVLVRKFNRFRTLPAETSEREIEDSFMLIVYSISEILDIDISPKRETMSIVSGLLADGKYALRSRSDINFHPTNSKQRFLASEVKTEISFSDDDTWYLKSRGAQIFTALYAFNCPTLLFNQKQWKLFVENKKRNAVYTFPVGEDYDEKDWHRHHELAYMGRDFLRVIAICILSIPEQPLEPAVPDAMRTPVRNTRPSPPENSGRKQQRTELGNKRPVRKTNANTVKVTPTFHSGYKDDVPLYSSIRVFSEDEVKTIEDEILLLEQAERTLSQ